MNDMSNFFSMDMVFSLINESFSVKRQYLKIVEKARSDLIFGTTESRPAYDK